MLFAVLLVLWLFHIPAFVNVTTSRGHFHFLLVDFSPFKVLYFNSIALIAHPLAQK